MYFSIKIALLFFCLCSAALARPVYDDSQQAASGDDHHGRVQIKVYRGPTDHDGLHHFAPWGFWVKQPADDDH